MQSPKATRVLYLRHKCNRASPPQSHHRAPLRFLPAPAPVIFHPQQHRHHHTITSMRHSGGFFPLAMDLFNIYDITLDSCRDLCTINQHMCQSYVFYPNGGSCIGYMKPISQLGFQTPGTGYLRYDLGCGAVTSGSPLPASSTSAIAPLPLATPSSFPAIPRLE